MVGLMKDSRLNPRFWSSMYTWKYHQNICLLFDIFITETKSHHCSSVLNSRHTPDTMYRISKSWIQCVHSIQFPDAIHSPTWMSDVGKLYILYRIKKALSLYRHNDIPCSFSICNKNLSKWNVKGVVEVVPTVYWWKWDKLLLDAAY